MPADAAADPAAAVPGLDLEARTLELSFSSEAPVERWFGNEVLSHEKGAPTSPPERRRAAAVQPQHGRRDRRRRARLDRRTTARATRRAVRQDARGDEVLGMVADGILRNVSFMYQASTSTGSTPTRRTRTTTRRRLHGHRWEAYEISIVSVPADQSVGVGRALAVEERSVEVETPTRSAPPAATAEPSNLPENLNP
jgi:hypothetical protein